MGVRLGDVTFQDFIAFDIEIDIHILYKGGRLCIPHLVFVQIINS